MTREEQLHSLLASMTETSYGAVLLCNDIPFCFFQQAGKNQYGLIMYLSARHIIDFALNAICFSICYMP